MNFVNILKKKTDNIWRSQGSITVEELEFLPKGLEMKHSN